MLKKYADAEDLPRLKKELYGVAIDAKWEEFFLFGASKAACSAVFDQVLWPVARRSAEALCSRDINLRLISRIKRIDPNMFMYITRYVDGEEGTAAWIFIEEKYGHLMRDFLSKKIDEYKFEKEYEKIRGSLFTSEHYADYAGVNDDYFKNNYQRMFEEMNGIFYGKIVFRELFSVQNFYYIELIPKFDYTAFRLAGRVLFGLTPGRNMLLRDVKS
jgi:hypothetical protein